MMQKQLLYQSRAMFYKHWSDMIHTRDNNYNYGLLSSAYPDKLV